MRSTKVAISAWRAARERKTENRVTRNADNALNIGLASYSRNSATPMISERLRFPGKTHEKLLFLALDVPLHPAHLGNYTQNLLFEDLGYGWDKETSPGRLAPIGFGARHWELPWLLETPG